MTMAVFCTDMDEIAVAVIVVMVVNKLEKGA
jgi:hypothetical protein